MEVMVVVVGRVTESVWGGGSVMEEEEEAASMLVAVAPTMSLSCRARSATHLLWCR